MTGPLAGVRVLDLGTRISAPFCAGLLGEQGAEVIKIEEPGTGDFMRTIGPFADGYSLFWAVEGRGRKSITLDLRTDDGTRLFTRLAEHADVICENFRPGTLERWGIGPDDIDADRAKVWVRISVFGQDGPYSQRPGLDRLGIGYGGLLHLTGYPDRPPVRPGVTVSDYLTGVFAAQAATALLYAGRGGVVDAPLYGSVLRILEWTIAAHDRLGVTRTREGNRLKNSAPLDNYPTKDGRWVCVVAGSDANFERLCRAMGRPDLPTDPQWDTLAKRAARSDEINGIVAEWTSTLTAAEVERACVEHDVPVGTAYTADDIVHDPHMQARHDIVTVEDPVIGPVRQQAPFPRIDGGDPVAPTGAPTLGQHNDDVWSGLVGLSPDELAGYRRRGVI